MDSTESNILRNQILVALDCVRGYIRKIEDEAEEVLSYHDAEKYTKIYLIMSDLLRQLELHKVRVQQLKKPGLL